jgi:hypothetical protein
MNVQCRDRDLLVQYIERDFDFSVVLDGFRGTKALYLGSWHLFRHYATNITPAISIPATLITCEFFSRLREDMKEPAARFFSGLSEGSPTTNFSHLHMLCVSSD